MYIEITDTLIQPRFQPFTIQIRVDTENEARLWHDITGCRCGDKDEKQYGARATKLVQMLNSRLGY